MMMMPSTTERRLDRSQIQVVKSNMYLKRNFMVVLNELDDRVYLNISKFLNAHILYSLSTELFQKKDTSFKRKKSGGKPPRKKFKKTG